MGKLSNYRKLYLFVIILIINIILHSYVSAQDNLNLNQMLTQVDTNNMLLSDSYYIWGSSVVKGKDGKYHMFFSRWAHGKRNLDDDSMNYIFNGFKGWLKYSEIAYAVSDNLTGPYKIQGTVLKGNGNPEHWDRFTYHNPQVRCFNGKCYLYYISNSYNPYFDVNSQLSKEDLHWLRYNCTQKIGVAIADSPEDFIKGNFTKLDQPLISPDGVNTFEIVNNPSVTQGPDDKYYMIFKSRMPNVGNMTLWIAVSDKPDGQFKLLSKVFTEPDMACEDPCLWYDYKLKRFYAAVKYYSNSKKLISQFGGIALITSLNATNWEAAKNPLISKRQLLLKNNTMLELSNLERPFVYTDANGQPLAIFAAFSVNNPGKVKPENYTPEYNTGNVGILLKTITKNKK